MKINKTGLTKFLPLIIIVFSILFMGEQVRAETDYGITSIELDPSPLVIGENFTVTVVFYDTTNISQVKLLICTLTPKFLCEPQPTLMIEVNTGTYEGIFLVDYDVGTTVGYHIIIVYENFTSVIIPETPAFLDMDIVEPLAGYYFFNAGAVQQPTDETGCCGIIILILAISSVSLISKKNKKT